VKKRDQRFLDRVAGIALETECAKRSTVPKSQRERLAEARRLLRALAGHPCAADDEDDEEERSVIPATGQPRRQQGDHSVNSVYPRHQRTAGDAIRAKIGGSGRII